MPDIPANDDSPGGDSSGDVGSPSPDPAAPHGIPVFDGFNRGNGLPTRWEASIRVLIDHACYVVKQHRDFRQTRTVRDYVLVACARRSVVTAEAVRLLATARLHEPARAVVRTLNELYLRCQLVTREPGDREAKVQAGFQYKASKRTAERILGDLDTRTNLAKAPTAHQHVLDYARMFKGELVKELFEDVAQELERRESWHGFASYEDAFKAVNETPLYTQGFAGASEYVHADSPDRDFVERADGVPVPAPVRTADPIELGRTMAQAAERLAGILLTFLADMPLQRFQQIVQTPGAAEGLSLSPAVASEITYVVRLSHSVRLAFHDVPDVGDEEAPGERGAT